MQGFPLIPLDYPDPDVIRVGDCYYMVSTTMHFVPGGEILQSDDLIHWTHCTYLFDQLEQTEEHALENGKDIYGKGMWAASLVYENGVFYCVFSLNESKTTAIYQSKQISGPWVKKRVEGFYHDPSLYIENEKFYLIYGNTRIYLQEILYTEKGFLKKGPKQLLIEEKNNPYLGYEGSHFYKIHGLYYLFVIHSSPKKWRRIQACFVSKELSGPYIGKDIVDSDFGYCSQGVAQGGIVETPNAQWYAILFQDRGAVGRLPVLLEVQWENDWPVLTTIEKKAKGTFSDKQKQEPLVGSDAFSTIDQRTQSGLHPRWQFNHNPNLEAVFLDYQNNCLQFTTTIQAETLLDAKNTITQRLCYPESYVTVEVDGSFMKNGDIAGIAAFQGDYAWIGLMKENNQLFICMAEKEEASKNHKLIEKRPINEMKQKIGFSVDFYHMNDHVTFYYETHEKRWEELGNTHKLHFSMDHFTGCRVGLFYFSTVSSGGTVGFKQFVYHTHDFTEKK